MANVAVTGIGLVTPLGCEPASVLDRILRGDQAARPAPFGPSVACPLFAPVEEFDATQSFPDNKTLRLMNRDAQMAAVAARAAMRDAKLTPGGKGDRHPLCEAPEGPLGQKVPPALGKPGKGDRHPLCEAPEGPFRQKVPVTFSAGREPLYAAEEIALYGATGLCGLPPTEIAGLLRNAAAADGSLSLQRFGQVALRRIRPVLSFKILANMPICFVSIFENLRGPNAVYTPWEGQGAQAIAAAMHVVADGDVPCAVVGGCDVKTHALAFLSLQQFGVFDSWQQHATGTIPGEGAAFLVLESHEAAVRRGARVYATLRRHATASVTPRATRAQVLSHALSHLDPPPRANLVSAADGDPAWTDAEQTALRAIGLRTDEVLRPKPHWGNLFAAAAAGQVALAALLAHRRPESPVVANCFGHGTEQAAFLLEAP